MLELISLGVLAVAGAATGAAPAGDRPIVFGMSLKELAALAAVTAAVLGALYGVIRWLILYVLESPAAHERIFHAVNQDKGRQVIADGSVLTLFERPEVLNKLIHLLQQEEARKAIAESLADNGVRDALGTAISAEKVSSQIISLLASNEARERMAAVINSEVGRTEVAAALNSKEAENVIVSFLNREKGRREVALALNSPEAEDAIARAIAGEATQKQLLQFLATDPAQKRVVATLESAGVFNAEHVAPAITEFLLSQAGRARIVSALREPDAAGPLLESVLQNLFMNPVQVNNLARLLQSQLIANMDNLRAIAEDAVQRARDLQRTSKASSNNE